MDDSTNLDPIVNDSLSDKADTIICEKSALAGKACIDNDVKEWSVVYFETDEEEDVEGFNDLIPSSWITNVETLCWYPMNEHKATIQKWVKNCAKSDSKWSCFSIKKIQGGIGNYDRGMKMLVKIAKNPNASLYSDIEDKGKGKRLKKPVQHFDNLNKENLENKRNPQSILPPIPKLSNVSKLAQANRPLPDKMDKMEINVPTCSKREPLKDKKCKEVKLPKESSFLKEKHNLKSATSSSDFNKCSFQKSLNIKGCKSRAKNHECAYTLEGEVTLESVANAVCHLNDEILSCKLTLRKIDKNVESFLESEMIAKKPPTIENTTEHVLDEFPIKNVDDLKRIERKLKKDETFHLKVVDALHLGVVGESLQKKINSVLRMVLDDKLASLFNWKGQRGDKLKLSKRRITKIMIEAVTKEFPTINETIFGRKAGPWLAQAIYRMRKHNSNNDETHPDDESSDSCESNDDDNGNEDDEDDEDLKG